MTRIFLFDVSFNNLGRFQGTVIAPHTTEACDLIEAALREEYNESPTVEEKHLKLVRQSNDGTLHSQVNFF